MQPKWLRHADANECAPERLTCQRSARPRARTGCAGRNARNGLVAPNSGAAVQLSWPGNLMASSVGCRDRAAAPAKVRFPPFVNGTMCSTGRPTPAVHHRRRVAMRFHRTGRSCLSQHFALAMTPMRTFRRRSELSACSRTLSPYRCLSRQERAPSVLRVDQFVVAGGDGSARWARRFSPIATKVSTSPAMLVSHPGVIRSSAPAKAITRCTGVRRVAK
jgi:hypothetical protein